MTDKRVFIERRPGEGDYAVRKPGSERASVVLPTQAEAIDWATATRRGRFRRARSRDEGRQSGQVAPTVIGRARKAQLRSRSLLKLFWFVLVSVDRSPAARSAPRGLGVEGEEAGEDFVLEFSRPVEAGLGRFALVSVLLDEFGRGAVGEIVPAIGAQHGDIHLGVE